MHGFELGFTSGGRWIHDGRQMRDLIGEFGPSGYWSQQDIWIGRDGRMMRRAIHQSSWALLATESEKHKKQGGLTAK